MVSRPNRAAASANSSAPFGIPSTCYYNRVLTHRRILVTGGAGYIGSHTVRQLLREGHDVTVVDNLSKGYRHNVPEGRLYEMDLADTESLVRLIGKKKCEAAIHFAAFIAV